MSIAAFWDTLKHRPAARTASFSIPAAQVLDEAGPDVEEAPGYFQIRLSEMYLRDAREWWQEVVPATLFQCDFKYGDEAVRVPFFVSNQMLQELQAGGQSLQKVRVRFRNTRIVGPVPYVGDEIAIFAGLFKVTVKDARKSLFAVFEKLFAVVDVGVFAQYLKLAEKLSDDLLACFDMSGVECVLAERNVFASQLQPLRTGYHVMLNAPASKIDAASLCIVDGSLHVRSGETTAAFDACDYCVIRVENLARRNDHTTLPFHKHWNEARDRLAQPGQLAEAKASLIACLRGVLASKDLTDAHKDALVLVYQAEFVRAHKALSPFELKGDERSGSGGDSVSAGAQFQALAGRARAAAASSSVERALDRIETLAERTGELRSNEDWETAIGEQLTRAVATSRARTNDLVHALTSGMLAD